MSWLGSLVHGAEHLLGSAVSGGAHQLGDDLNMLGLHSAARAVDAAGDKAGYALGADVPELQLGQTQDPAELVHGDPAAIRGAAGRLKTFSGAFGEAAAGLAGLESGHWTGQAADAFRARYEPFPGRWRNASLAARDASTALESYAGAAESAQRQAGQAVSLYAEGERATAAAQSAYDQRVTAYNQAAQAYSTKLAAGQDPGTAPARPGAFSDPGEQLRARAQQLLTSARQARDTAAESSTAAITSAASLAPAEPSFLDQLAADFSDTLQAGNLLAEHFTGGIVKGAADLVKFGRTLDPLDSWNMTHLAEYAGGLSATATGLAHDVAHPQDLVAGVVGSGWGSDPAEALGRLVPNIALAAGTGGAGSAADAAAGLGERALVTGGEDAARAGLSSAADGPEAASRGLQDMTTAADPVDVATGDVVLAQTDVTLPGVLPLVVERMHRSSWRAGRWFGRSWASTLDQRLDIGEDRAVAVFADGRVLVWPRPGGDGEPVLPVTGPRWPLTRHADGACTVTDPQSGLAWRYERRSGYYLSGSGSGELPLVRVTGRNGSSCAFGYHDTGEPASITHSGGYQIRVLGAGGRVRALALAGAAAGGADLVLVCYRYDEHGNLAGIVNSSGEPLRLSYDGAGRLTGWHDRNGHGYRYHYDEHGRCARTEGPDGALSGSFGYAAGVTTWTDAAGAATTYTLGDGARVAAVTDPLGAVTRWEHDSGGRVTLHRDPLGRVTRYGYDGAGNLTAVTRPDGTAATARYTELNLPAEVTGPDGSTVRHDYDARGNLQRVTAPDGSVTDFRHNGPGLTGVTDGLGADTRIDNDAAGLPVAVTGADGAVTRYERDALGRVTSITGPGGSVTRLEWTLEGQLAARVLPDGSAEQWSYDPEGNLVSHLSPSAALTRYEYGFFDLVTARTGPGGARTEFGYDHGLRLTEVRHGGLRWQYEYDPAGRLVTQTDYNGAAARYTYDPAGQLTTRVNAAGQAVEFRYDALGQVTGRDSAGGPAAFAYDAAGRLVRARNAAADVGLAWDAAGRLTAETCNGASVRSAYDAAGRRVTRVTPSGAQARWDYDAAGRPVGLGTAGQRITFGYDPDGQEIRRELPGMLVLTQTWDPVGRLSEQMLTGVLAGGATVGGGSADGATAGGRADVPAGARPGGRLLQRRSYAYRPDGCLTGIDDLLAGPQRFGLDPAGRVTRVTGSGWAEQYAYDPAGNVTSAAWPVPPDPTAGLPAADVLGDDLQGQREYTGTLITRAGSVRYEHDECGRIILRQRKRDSRKPGTWRYEWDADDRLTSVTTPGGTVWRYRYDPLGRRVARQRLAEGGNVVAETTFTWDGPVLAEQATSLVSGPGDAPAPGHVLTWDYQPGSFTPATQTERTIPPGAPQDAMDERFYAIVTDLIGNPTELTAPDGSLAGYQQHVLWGGTRWTPGGAHTPLRFPGQYADPETGLHYNHHRYYDPVTGRYLTPDPLGLAPAPNPHTYVPNPQTQTDPLGLAAPCPDPAGRTFGNYSSHDLLNAAQSGDRNGLTQAGRALQKHSDRAGSFFQGRSSGPAALRNDQGMQAVSEILNNPASQTEVLNRVINIWAPTGQGIRYGIDGSFMGFLEPVP